MFYIFTYKQQKIQSIPQIQDLIQSRNESIGLKPSYFLLFLSLFFIWNESNLQQNNCQKQWRQSWLYIIAYT